MEEKMEVHPEEELFEKLAAALGEPLEQVWRMPDLERRQLIEVLGLGIAVEEKAGEGVHKATVLKNTNGAEVGEREQMYEDIVKLEESAKSKDLVEPAVIVSEGNWASPVEKQMTVMEKPFKLKEDTAKLERLLIGTRNEAMGREYLEAYLEAHMDNPNRVKVVLEELTGVGDLLDADTHLVDQDAKPTEELYQGKGKGQGKGKSNTLKRGLTDVDPVAEGEHRGKGLVENREVKQRKLEENHQGRENGPYIINPAVPAKGVEVENQQTNATPQLPDMSKVVIEPKGVFEEEKLLIEVQGAQNELDTVSPGPGPSSVLKQVLLHPGGPGQQQPLKLKDIRELVNHGEERLVEQQQIAAEVEADEKIGQNGGFEAVEPGLNLEDQIAQNGQAPMILDESVVIIDPDGKGGDDVQVLQLLRKQLTPARDRVYSPEVRKLAESLAEMFPNTPLSYLLHRCPLQLSQVTIFEYWAGCSRSAS